MPTPDDARGLPHTTPLRVVFFGMTGAFSRRALEELLRAGIDVVAVVLPALAERVGQPPLLPLLPLRPAAPRGVALPLFAAASPRTILDIAAERNMPVREVGRKDADELLAGLDFDAIAVACFSRRLPASLLRLPRLGCLNIHPSLLPAHRGPDPLFWIFHDDDETGGVTVHLMDEGFDSGPIVVQETLPFPDDLTETELERACATRGGVLLAEALFALDAGTSRPQPQDETWASYQSWPTDDDYIITSAWSARRAYRFIKGIGGRAEQIRFVADDGATFVLRAALEYNASATLDVPWRLDGDTLTLRCLPGVLRCQIAR